MAYQFVHMGTYARKPDTSGRSTAFIFDEAERRPEACQHVAEPASPVVVYGATLAEVRALHDSRTATAMTEAAGKARRIRFDQHTLGTVVASFPVAWDDLRGEPMQTAALADWQRRTVDWLRGQFGDQLAAVVRHEDERFPHLHAYIIPTDPTMRAKRLHPGWLAKEAAITVAKADGAGGKETNARGDTAYKSSMRAWQDSYWQAVGLPCGLARLGPGRRRLSRAAWQAEKAAARTTAELLQRAVEAQRTVEDADAGLQGRFQAAAAREARAAVAVEKARAAITEAKARLAKAQQAVDEAEAYRRQAAVVARQEARVVIGRARAEGVRLVAEAEARAAPMRRVGGWLGSLWSGFRSVDRRLACAADSRIAAAKNAAAVEVAEAKERMRREARQEVKDVLADLRQAAARADQDREAAERRLGMVEAEARHQADVSRQAQKALAAERSARLGAESERERFRTMWAEADNKLIELDSHLTKAATWRR